MFGILYFGFKNIFGTKNFFWTQNLFEPKMFLDPKFFKPSFYFGFQNFFGTKDFFGPKNFFWTQKLSWTQNPIIFLDSKIFQTQIFFDPKRSSLVLWYKPTKPKSFEPKTYQAEHFRPKSCSYSDVCAVKLILDRWMKSFMFQVLNWLVTDKTESRLGVLNWLMKVFMRKMKTVMCRLQDFQ